MVTVALALLVCLAGYMIHPALTGFYTLNRSRPDWLGVAMAIWSLGAAAVTLVIAAILWPGTPVSWLGPLFTARQLALAFTIVMVVLVMGQLTGQIPVVLTAVLFGVLALRAILWITTDLVWQHTFDAGHGPQYGFWRGPLSAVVLVLILAEAIYAITRRPWTSQLARTALTYVIFPGFLLSVVATVIPGAAGEYLTAVALSAPVVAVQFMFFRDFRQQHKRLRLIAERETSLASFGADVLAETATVPELAAVMLVADIVGEPCEFVPAADGRGDVIASATVSDTAGRAGTDSRAVDIAFPVEVAGATVGVLRTKVPKRSEDDAAFVSAVGAVLGAALSRSHSEAALRDDALRDSLTGLPNWSLLHDRLERLLEGRRNLPVGVLCCDIQGLKEINDEFGHDVGDVVLKTVGARLSDLASEYGTASRIGGDEFVLVEPFMTAPDVDALAQRIVAAAAAPITSGASKVRVRVRVGFTVVQESGRNPDLMLRDAEMAVNRARHDGRAIAAFSDSVRDELVGRRQMIRELRAAIAGGTIDLAYQPIVDMSTREVVAVETLARWRDSVGNNVPPPVFIGLAEEMGTMGALGSLIFDKAMAQFSEWNWEYPHMRTVRMSLNVAPAQMLDPGFPDRMAVLLELNGIEPSRITLEVTESGLAQATEIAAAQLHRLRSAGFGVSLDDFGTGYSSLTRLAAFPVTELKIDRQFIDETLDSARVIVPAVVGLAHASGQTVVAEGIETESQFRFVMQHGCDYGQGYLFDRPLSGDAVPEHVKASLRG
ncbi:MAG: bifunctional diguanylate cyclase/phosphodiesterase [Actinomycetes bacterium]